MKTTKLFSTYVQIEKSITTVDKYLREINAIIPNKEGR